MVGILLDILYNDRSVVKALLLKVYFKCRKLEKIEKKSGEPKEASSG